MAGYGSDEDFDAWLAANGYELTEEIGRSVLRQRGSAYIDGLYGARFSGTPTGGISQERAWPRTGATAYGAAISDSQIPEAVVQASYAAAYYEDQNPGGLAVAISTAQAVKREKVGSLEVEYFGADGVTALEAATPTLLAVEGLLAPLLVPINNISLGIWAV